MTVSPGRLSAGNVSTVRPGRLTEASPARPAVLASILLFWCVVAFSRPQFISAGLAIAVGLLFLVILQMTCPSLALPVPMVVLLLIFIWLSISWSDVPQRSALGALATTLVAVLAAATAWRIDALVAMRVVDLALKSCLVASLAMAVALPHVGVEQGAASYGSMVGIYGQKNMLGTMLSLGFATHAATAQFNRIGGWAWFGAYAAAIGWSQSVGTVVSVGVVLAVWFSTHRLGREGSQRRRLLRFGGRLTFGLLALLVLLANVGRVAAGLGRDLSFSGRTDIWQGAWSALQEQLAFGYGWDAAFTDSSVVAISIERYTNWYVTSAHSGFLTVAVQIGMVGLVLALLIPIGVTARALQLYLREPSRETYWLLQIAVVFWTTNLIESRYQWLMWFVLVLAAGLLANRKRGPRVEGQTGKGLAT